MSAWTKRVAARTRSRSSINQQCHPSEGQLFELVIAGRVLRTTPEHPFFVEGQGWTPAGELQPGNLLSTATGEWLPVESITNTHQSVTVYNFRVSNYHTYFIAPWDAAFDVWVHNTYARKELLGSTPGK